MGATLTVNDPELAPVLSVVWVVSAHFCMVSARFGVFHVLTCTRKYDFFNPLTYHDTLGLSYFVLMV